LSRLTKYVDACGRPPVTPNNLSTLSLKFDREGLVYVLIQQQAVAMRISDYRLNASAICNAAGLNKNERSKYISILQSRGVVTYTTVKGMSKHSWVPFQDGVFLCQALKLAKQMEGLFSKAPIAIPAERENYFLSPASRKAVLPKEYAAMEWNNMEMVYIPSKGLINAAHVLKLGDKIYRSQLSKFLLDFKISNTVVRGNPRAQGTYISFQDARQLCQHFDLSLDPIEELLARDSRSPIPVPAIGAVVNTAQVTLDNDIATDFPPPSVATPVVADSAGTTSCGAVTSYTTYGGSFSVGGNWDPETLSAAPSASPSVFKDLSTDLECGEAVAGTDHYSQYTESNYENGSYLAPVNRSYEEMML
jgi:hypothetical protein